jgi:hypothetical protein
VTYDDIYCGHLYEQEITLLLTILSIPNSEPDERSHPAQNKDRWRALCGYSNKPSVFIRAVKFNDQISDYDLLIKNSALRNQLINLALSGS